MSDMYLMSQRYQQPGIEGVISDYHNPDYRDPNVKRNEAAALQNLKSADMKFRENKLPHLINWALNSEYYGNFLRYDPAKEILYTVQDGGSKLEEAVMYTIPQAELMTPDGQRMPAALLGAPMDFDKMIRKMSKETGQPGDIVEEYAMTHEYVHIMSTMSLLSNNTIFIEGTTDLILLDYYTDMMEKADSKDKLKYEKLRSIAEHRVMNLEKAGYTPHKNIH